MSTPSRMIGDEFTKSAPLTVERMRRVLLEGNSIAYHGKSGSRLITRQDEIPSIETLVEDGFIDDTTATDELDRELKRIKAQQLALEKALAARRLVVREAIQAKGPPKDDMEDIGTLLRRKKPGRPPKIKGTPMPYEIEDVPEPAPTGINENDEEVL